MSPDDLIAKLMSAPQLQLIVPDPAPPLRAAYRQTIWRAINERFAPEGFVLRHAGRDHGDLVIRLVAVGDAPAREGLAPIGLPETVDEANELVRQLGAAPDEVLPVTEASRERALRIMQAIAVECARRQYRIGRREDGHSTFQIAVESDLFKFVMSEEYESRETTDPERVAKARYEWQRVPVTVSRVGSGRLIIRLDDRFRTPSR
jgi:hypothetical protein